MTHFQGYIYNNNLLTKTMYFKLFFFFVLLLGVTTIAEHDDINNEEFVEAAGYGEEKLSTVLITGTLVCDYSSRKLKSISEPVKGAEVAVSCKAGKKVSKLSWPKASTDEYGDFVVDLPSEFHSIQDLDKKCAVKVLRLPDKYCSVCHYLIANNHKFATSLTLSSVDNGVRTYTAHTSHLQQKDLHNL